MSNDTIENSTPATEAQEPKAKRKPGRKTKATKKQAAKTSKPRADRANKKAGVIALMRRDRGATLAEIMKATDWQSHTVRGFVSILGSKGGKKIESSQKDAGERIYRITK